MNSSLIAKPLVVSPEVGLRSKDFVASRWRINNDEHAKEVNSVSARVAEEMARGVCLKYDVDIALGTTGYAEPYPQEKVLTPYGYFAIWQRQRGTAQGKVVASEQVFGEDRGRVEMQQYMTEVVLDALLQHLEYLKTSS